MAGFKFIEKDNCGVGVIANKYGIPQHEILIKSISALIKLSHRGAIQSDGRTGDGCGLLMQIPDEYFRSLLVDDEFQLADTYAAGNIFFSHHIGLAKQRDIIEEECARLGITELFFRKVPINVSVLGRIAKKSLPHIEQLFINILPNTNLVEFELLLFILRKNIEARLIEKNDFFICSLSSKTIIYKALCLPRILKEFYLDLDDPLFKTSLCVFHQRFSTNTQPSWKLAQPFRYLAHNGEINTVSANRNWAKSRVLSLLPANIQEKLVSCSDIISTSGSDSFSLDNMLELLITAGIDYKQAIRILIPPFSKNNNKLSTELSKWYQAIAVGYEPWDGPAGIVMTNGSQILACLDRNGLRPLRYSITQDGTVVIASEAGIVDYAPDDYVAKGRLGAGEMMLIDTQATVVLFDKAIYRQYDLGLTEFNKYQLLNTNDEQLQELTHDLSVYQKLFQVSYEEVETVLRPMGFEAMEAAMSMGDDVAIAVLSKSIRPLTDYFRQNFAQVTNPAIDSIREKYVMSLDTYLGQKPSIVMPGEFVGYKLTSPVLTNSQFMQIVSDSLFNSIRLDLSYDSNQNSLQNFITKQVSESVLAVQSGVNLIIISDRSIASNKLTVPAIMLVGAIHNALINQSIRLKCDIVVESATARDPHQFCVLLGFGATAIYPYLSYALLAKMQLASTNSIPLAELIANYLLAVNKGILKIMSKMGIATIASYRGSQLFEALGISAEVADLCFGDVISRIGGAGFMHFENDFSLLNQNAFNKRALINIGGNLKYTPMGEYHAFNPDIVLALQQAAQTGKYQDYLTYANLVNNRPVTCLRDLISLDLESQNEITDTLELVEPIEEIYRRFDSAAMSIGALSSEAHEALAIAMNTLGGHSNSGEGGEDPIRFKTNKNSKIKQIASGRFGVTPSYLMSAEIIQIKIAQGAKPGEGGQLPGGKVTVEIAKLRHATPGVSLISPPPHHDVYSIEDLAQLIFDLKQLNPSAQISVKLVSEPGIGVIACGVAKAQADLITISGYDGGTGAAPITSVKNAGSPWELGIAETHAALVANNLRHKIRLQVDGGLKTGLDIVKAAILGAESFGFGTAPMVTLGCKYLRICHLNNCATGLATQNAELRKAGFKGLPEMLINYFTGVASEVRELMAKLGIMQVVDLIGRTDLLTMLDTTEYKNVNLGDMLALSGSESNYPLHYTEVSFSHDRGVLNQRIHADCLEAVYNLESLEKGYTIYNTDRSVGATLAGEIAKNYGRVGLDNPIKLHFTGIAGQSFGVWAIKGMELYLLGEANDYVGKGLAGAKIVIRQVNPNVLSTVAVMGNTCLYGATSGRLYANGIAGDRFAARNSGVVAVIEGLASNGCEYMTGGAVAVLGSIEQNFGAGMTGGVCYIWDNIADVEENLNDDVELLSAASLAETYEIHQEFVRNLISRHYQETHSVRAAQFMADFESNFAELIIIKPRNISLQNLTNYLIK